MNVTELQAYYDIAAQQSLSFVCYRLPGEDKINCAINAGGRFMERDQLAELNASAHFIFAPFHSKDNLAFVMPLLMDSISNGKAFQPLFEEEDYRASDRDAFIHLVNGMIASIQSGAFTKLVASRAISDNKAQNFDAAKLFDSLCQKYPTAFVYWMYIPGAAEWMGASPEQLLKSEAGKVYTMSLAGSQVIVEGKDDYHWGEKEKEEQRIVTEFICQTMSTAGVTALNIQAAQNHRAGNMLHLRSDISGEISDIKDLHALVYQLHPTPAVCGLPKMEAMKYILDHENHQRKFYSGFLGILGPELNCNLFVNLRCMEISDKKLIRYVGCGITAASNAALEWQESVYKSQTLGKVIDELFPQN
jgi:isochorismate synthase